jgi:spore coat polysaccharide biosynthesis predicted glycosyltransferase SpsG
MSDYMRACDLCIAAGGTTVYELCASGIPSILYTLADNQLDCAHKVSEIKLIPWVGDIRNDLSLCLERIAIEIEQFHKSTYWEEVSKSMQSYVDGKGARRIANELLKYVR